MPSPAPTYLIIGYITPPTPSPGGPGPLHLHPGAKRTATAPPA